MKERPSEVEKLRANVEWALANSLPARELVPMLKKLIARTEADFPTNLFARQILAETLLETDPWQAALLARQVLDLHEDDRSWAVLGLAHTLLGNYRCAAKAYRMALRIAPQCPWYAHNLGHLLDVALGRPRDALHWLRFAYREVPGEVELAGSYAHALARSGRRDEARRVLKRALRRGDAAVEALLDDWLSRDPPGSNGKAAPLSQPNVLGERPRIFAPRC